jgi:hypothetical protein
MDKKPKKPKKPKKLNLPSLKRKLFSIWSEKVRTRANFQCEYCGKKAGDDKCNKVDAHHLQSRKIKSNPLKFDIMNGICLCPLHHKFSCNESFHNAPVVTMNWLLKNIPERFNYVLDHYNDEVDLDNPKVVLEIQYCLENNLPLNIENLKKIAKEFPRKTKSPQKEAVINIFDSLEQT